MKRLEPEFEIEPVGVAIGELYDPSPQTLIFRCVADELTASRREVWRDLHQRGFQEMAKQNHWASPISTT